MLPLCLGIVAFALYFLYDLNSIRWQRRAPRAFFAVGTVLLGAALVWEIVRACMLGAFAGLLDALLLVLGAACFLALIYSLFFALPFDETYKKQENGRGVYDRGVYAMCRHPGILFFFGMCLFCGLAALPAPGLLACGMLFSFLNLAYAFFQDRVTFPRTFSDYRAYQNNVPFLIPTKASLHLARRTLRRSGHEEGES